MAKAKGGYGIAQTVESIPKKTRQGRGQHTCLLYTSPSPRDVEESRMPSSA